MPTSYPLCYHCQGVKYDGASCDAVHRPSTAGSQWEQNDALPELPKLSTSAARGCTFCGYLIYVIRNLVPKSRADALSDGSKSVINMKLCDPAYYLRSDVIEIGPSWEDEAYLDEPDGPYWLNVVFSGDGWVRDWTHRAWVYQGSEPVARSLNIALRKPAEHVLEPQCTGIIQSWLSDCQSHHAVCRSWLTQSAKFSLMPTRLIDIGEASDSMPRLVCNTAASLPPSTRYVALSYCWGRPSAMNPQLITTTMNMKQHEAGIILQSMPQTFQDLITLARHLRLARYLWIDALCIVQDDPADWEREAAQMATVYRNAWLTVVAAAGDSCHSGFLSRMPQHASAIVPFTVDESPKDEGHLVLYPLNEYRFWDAYVTGHLHGSSWSRRAWTFQEDLLSTRVLYFGAETSFYRCQTVRCLENSVIVRPVHVSWHTFVAAHDAEDTKEPPVERNIKAAEVESSRRPSAHELHENWRLLISEYTERQLTRTADKLPALSGVAQIFSVAFDQDQYLAGLWRGDLVRDLLWLVYHDAVKISGDRAPTWSWTAWDGGIGYHRGHDQKLQPKCSVLEACAPAAGLNPFGAVDVSASRISLSRCRLVAVELRPLEVKEITVHRFRLLAGDTKSIAIGVATVDGVSIAGLESTGTFKPANVERASGM
ncbi:HET-domain-containing protein [Xylariaceae sp. FL0016]|nr:HET-domain-containing protein [Xylariaceae sp. FL0016]